jgi:hypothetical protein
VMDLFDRDQYLAFHGKEPPAGWREASPADVRAALAVDTDQHAFRMEAGVA